MTEPDYDLQKIRALLMTGFNDTNLYSFCHTNIIFKDLCDRFTAEVKQEEVVGWIMERAGQFSVFKHVLIWAEYMNPDAYARHSPYETGAGIQDDHSRSSDKWLR
jgi:hypothetical protein